MNRFNRIRHHVDMGDVKKRCLEESVAKKNKEKQLEEEKILRKKIYNSCKSDWRQDILDEGMTTSAVFSTTLSPEGETAISAIDPIDPASFSPTDSLLIPNDNHPAQKGSVIRSSGTGNGSDGGFDVGGDYLAFQGLGFDDTANMRWSVLSPVDSSGVDTLSITAIVGNDVNGGEDPDEFGEELRLMYRTPNMSQPRAISQTPDGTSVPGLTDKIIDINAAPNSGLNNYSIHIPEYARGKDTVFILLQAISSGSEYDHYGITNINFQRRTPVNVVVPLDDPQAISFINVGSNEGDPKKRKKKVNDQLESSDKYTATVMGNQFPGQGTRIDGEDPFRSATVTSDEDIKASPIGSDEVKKSFSSRLKDALGTTDASSSDIIKKASTIIKTSNQPSDKSSSNLSDFERRAQTATTTSEVEPVTPSTQTSLTPKTDDGEEISVKTLGGKNSGIVQGADAATLDAQEPEITEPETTQLEIDEPEEIKPEEIKASEEEKQDKTPEEIKGIEKEKFNAKANESANYIDKLVNFDLNLGLSSFNAFAQVAGTVLNTAINVISFGGNLLGFKTSQEGGYLGGLGKLKNSIKIAQGVLSGKIVNANPLPQEIKSFTDSIKLDEFTANIPINISSVRHEYADDNIYVKDGKVYSNRDGDREGVYATPLAGRGYKALGVHGNGYAQMIIPKDGSEPYLHYYDHNYENLLSIEDVSVSGGLIQTLKTDPEYRQEGVGPLMKSISNIIHQLKGNNMKFIPQKLRESLVSYFGAFDQVMEGLKSTSSLEGFPPGIHGSALTDFKVPLSKLPKETQEMIANHPLSWTPERIANMSGDDFTDEMMSRAEKYGSDEFKSTIMKALEDPDSEVDPEFLRVFKRSETIQNDYDKAVEELDKVRNSPEYNAASDAALKEYEDINAERGEKIAENDEKFGPKAQSAVWEKLVGPHYRAVGKVIRGGGSISKNDPTYQKMIDGKKEYDKQVKVLERKYRQGQKNILDKYKKLSGEAYAKYNDTITVKKLNDGTFGMVNGGDFTTKSGKVIPGKRTLSAKQQAKFDEVRVEQDEIRKYLRTANYEDNLFKPFVLYDVKTEFSKYGISGESWSPEKKGSGLSNIPPEFYDPFANEVKPNLGAKPGDKLASSLSGGGYGDYYDVGRGDYRSIDQILRMHNDPNKGSKYPGYMLKNIDQLMIDLDLVSKPKDTNLGSVASYVGGDATAAATAAAANKRDRRRGKTSMVAHYKPKGTNLFERIKPKPFFNPKDIKPTFPENDPPQLDPKTGMHPNYGKQAGRYKKLDPMSANAMPPTGDPEIDAVVDKQRTKPKSNLLFNKIKGLIKKG